MSAVPRKPVWTTLAVALTIHAVLMSFQVGRRIDTSFMRLWILDALTPMEKLVDRAILSVRQTWNGYIALIGVHDENRELRSQIDELRMEIVRQREEVLEAQRLRALLDFPDAGVGITVVARIIGSDTARGNLTVTIDKGRSHGIQPDAAVIIPDGIVGRVIHAANFSSIVQLILDSQSGVGVMLRSTRIQGVVRGMGGSELELEYIEDDNTLREGDELITSGMDQIYPKGLPVGVISSVGPRRGLLKTVHIRPHVDFGRLEEVLCIVSAPEPGQVEDRLDETVLH